ncbi:MAG: helix-turn-helix transcriptional regulator [Ignavibacteria bacterium]|nr:helix-turn-helix transcriptional regulator [Ignavibacteria bacterium]
MENIQKIIGSNIKELREKFKFDQKEIAHYLGVLRETVSYYENGNRNIPVESLVKLADLFGVDLADLYEEDFLTRESNKAFAFRKEDFDEKDLVVLAEFHKIVKNYIKMDTLGKQNG